MEGECPICYDVNPTYVTRCNHKFHEKCIKLWLTKNSTCPMCRHSLKDVFILKNKFKLKRKIQCFKHHIIIYNSFSKYYVPCNNLKLVDIDIYKHQLTIEAKIKTKLKKIIFYADSYTINQCYTRIADLINNFSNLYMPLMY